MSTALKLPLRHVNYCDGCGCLKDIGTLGGHKRCAEFKINMLPDASVEITSKGLGQFMRPQICKDKNEAVIQK